MRTNRLAYLIPLALLGGCGGADPHERLGDGLGARSTRATRPRTRARSCWRPPAAPTARARRARRRSMAGTQARTFWQPAACVTSTQQNNIVTYTLADCTGPYGLVHVTRHRRRHLHRRRGRRARRRRRQRAARQRRHHEPRVDGDLHGQRHRQEARRHDRRQRHRRLRQRHHAQGQLHARVGRRLAVRHARRRLVDADRQPTPGRRRSPATRSARRTARRRARSPTPAASARSRRR